MVVVGVLGPVVLRGDDGAPVPVGSGRQRRLLAVLALHAGTDVDRDVLADLVWGDEQPGDPVAALQTNVARLRRVLPATVSIATGPRGYRLAGAADGIDTVRFRAHLDAAAATADPGQRLGELDAALALWRGRPFAEFEHPAIEPEVARLTGLHTNALEDRAEALLRLGRAAEAAAAAGGLVTADPLRERAVGVLIRALVGAGRPAEALQAFARLRAELAEQLGADPSPELVRLHEQVLRQEIREAPSVPRPAVPISSFVGREADLVRVDAMLAECRVVTLCGPGGVGKTRLARHAAAAVADRYQDGVLVVELAAAAPDAVVATVAAALRLADGGPGPLLARIVEVLAVHHQLLVLDDCEHALAAVAALVEAIALGAPRVDMLVTSREALRVDGEQVLPVAPLGAAAAVTLLVDRIRAVDPDAVPAAEPAVLEQVCARLDRLPLALELAAARVPAMGLAGLRDALDDPLSALGRGRRTAAARHRSLREVVEWSFRLLDEPARNLFTRLAVFAGPVEPAAVAAVCGPQQDLPDLVDRSLVVRVGTDPVSYTMLDTLRAFGRTRLATDPDVAALRARHTAWAVRLVADTGNSLGRPDEAMMLRRFDAHFADIGRAHAWLVEHGPVEDLLRISLVCAELGNHRLRADLNRLVEEALAAAGCVQDGADIGHPEVGPSGHPLLPRLLALSAVPLWQCGDLNGAERRAIRALALADRLGDPLAGRDAHEVLANVAGFRGQSDLALRHGVRAIELAEAAGDPMTRLLALVDCATIAAYAGDQAVARGHELAAIRLAEGTGSPLAEAWACYAAGESRAEAGDPAAVAFLERAVELAEQVDAGFVAGVARHTLLTTAARAEDAEQTLTRFGPLLDAWHGMGAWTQLWIAVRALAEALSRLDRHADAAVLLGALRASPRASVAYGADSARVRAVEAAAAAALGRRVEELMAHGATLGDAGAVALARRLAR